MDSYINSIKEGKITQALAISKSFQSLTQLKIQHIYDLLKTIPDQTDSSDLLKLLKQDLLPSILSSYTCDYNTTIDSPTSHTTNATSSTTSNHAVEDTVVVISTLKIANIISEWAIDYEDIIKNPYESLQYTNISIDIICYILGLSISMLKLSYWPVLSLDLTSVPVISSPKDESIEQWKDELIYKVFKQQYILSFICNIWTTGQGKIRWTEVEKFGVPGVIFQRMWDTPLSNFVTLITEIIAPLIKDVLYTTQDTLLHDWVLHSLQSRVLGEGEETDLTHLNEPEIRVSGTPSDIEESGFGQDLARLKLGTELIESAGVKAQLVLLLLQLPAVSNIKAGSTLESNASIKALYELAQCISTQSDVDASIRESLVEALRLQCIQALVASYGVENIDARNPRQLRTVAGLISIRVSVPSSIADAIEIIQAWSTGNLNVSGLLSRALLHRATYRSDDCSDDMMTYRATLLRDALTSVLQLSGRALHQYHMKLSTIVENTISALVDTLRDLCIDTEEGAKEELMIQYKVACESAIVILSWYLEEKNAHQNNKNITNSTAFPSLTGRSPTSSHSGGRSKVGFRSSEAVFFVREDIYSVITPHILSLLKRLRYLCSEFDVCITLHNLQDAVYCKATIASMATTRADELIQENELLNTTNDSGSNSRVGGRGNSSRDIGEVLTLKNQRACALLEVSSVYFTYTVMKVLFKRNETVSYPSEIPHNLPLISPHFLSMCVYIRM